MILLSFYNMTELYSHNLVCGFINEMDHPLEIDMWNYCHLYFYYH